MPNAYENAIKSINTHAAHAAAGIDKKFAAEMAKAKKYLESNYNKYAEEGDRKNAEIMTHFNLLVKFAFRHADDRSKVQNKETMKNISAVLRRGESQK